jgi:hypothetical protein
MQALDQAMFMPNFQWHNHNEKWVFLSLRWQCELSYKGEKIVFGSY